MTNPKRTFRHGDAEARRRKALERLGTDKPKCVVCDVIDPFYLQLHHVAGKDNDDCTVILCLNHHAHVSDLRKDIPLSGTNPEHPANRLGHILIGIAELLTLMIAMIKEAGLYLIELASPKIGNAEAEVLP